MSYPYKVDYNDHFETPRRAYEDVLPLLDLISPSARGSLNTKESKKRKRSLPSNRDDHTLYDPYYCAGRAKDLLNTIGFQNVQHAKRDFYADVRNGTVPEYDTLVTNPPYSEDHKERCIEYAVQSLRKEGKPFLLLMPNYVALKEYWRKLTQTANGKEADDIVYVIPASPYEYDHPEGTGHEVPPFASLWFCGVGRNAVEECKKAYQGSGNIPRVACSIKELQAMGSVRAGNRKNPKQRRKMKKLMAAAAGAVDTICGGVTQETGGVDKEAKRQQKKKKKTQRNDNRAASQSPSTSAANISNASGKKKKKKSKHRDASGVRKKKRF